MSTLAIVFWAIIFAVLCAAMLLVGLLEKPPYIEETDAQADARVSSIKAHLRPEGDTEIRESDFAELAAQTTPITRRVRAGGMK